MATAPSGISLRQLQPAVDAAVKAAIARHQAKTTSGFVINPGILAGPLLDPATNIQTAQQIAAEITQQVQAKIQGGGAAPATAQPLQSGVLITGRHIICGFFPYPAPELNVEQ